jgi:hypothetical protein
MGERDPLQALLALVESDRVGRRERIEREAREAARERLSVARRAARERVHAALLPERRRLREGLASLEARLATEKRLAAQHRLRERLDDAWRELPGALAARWRDAASRKQWTDHVRAAALDALGPGEWRVDHAPGWPQDEREAFSRECVPNGPDSVSFRESPDLAAGLVVRAGGNGVDGSLAGLLADRDALDARLADALGFGEATP